MKYHQLLLASMPLIFNCTLAGAQDATPADQPEKPPRIVTVRGNESYIEDLNMGPQATALWKRIQWLIANPDLKDFSWLVLLFDLSPSEPLDVIHIKKPGTFYDFKGRDPLIASGSYGVGIPSGGFGSKFIGFRLDFDLSQVCITKNEIARVYRLGPEVVSVHSPWHFERDKTGLFHGFAVQPPSRGGFFIAASGCATKFSIEQPLN